MSCDLHGQPRGDRRDVLLGAGTFDQEWMQSVHHGEIPIPGTLSSLGHRWRSSRCGHLAMGMQRIIVGRDSERVLG
jgi:hypothetical protein